ncbi:prokaryotic molybdopterin-containing oxidoreductase family, membrane subunit [Thermus arciformis]|uniref:Prokaryotic molybdopterin-containing oxidoreductase family, membrane subunit n=1 Tax=Thermus arciformis TaxID=482827 RepID=A0A1G7JN07_9DEIN|nr:NrfD/PsrC family molybdoenzyme membrane anchor subunit [Thermus arciformis]SDF26174.1 prokaryotic molybdopterin-containing oxidoreductase family, membrane subunit [Thermus arciformis]
MRVWGWILYGVLAAIGLGGFFLRFATGHQLAGYGSYVPWGLWVAAYIYFIGLSAGAFLLSALVYVFGVRKLEPIAPLALVVALASLLMALVTIWFDLGHMERFYYVYLRPNFRSMMAWMVWLYTAYGLLLLAELYYALRRHLPRYVDRGGITGFLARLLVKGRKTPFTQEEIHRDEGIIKVLGTIGVPLAIAFHGGVGALFGTVVAQDLWHSPIYPILFLTGALLSGGALITAVYVFFWPRKDEEWRELSLFLGRIVLGLILFDLLLEWAEYSIPMWYGVGPEFKALWSTLFGRFWYVYWVFHILIGVVVPIGLLLAWGLRGRVKAIGLASFLVAITFLAIRLNLVIPSLVHPKLEGLMNAYRDHRLVFAYLPTWFEWSVVVFSVALGFTVTYVLVRILPVIEGKLLKEVA